MAAAEEEDARTTAGAKCGRRAGLAARRGEWLRAARLGTGCEGHGLPRTSAAEAGQGVAGLREGGSASQTLESGLGAVARRPAVRAPRGAGEGRGAPSAAGRRRGAAVAIQGLRAAAMQREEAGGGEREEGRARGERASERAPRLLAGTAARSEVARGAGGELLRVRAGPGSAAPQGRDRAGLPVATGGFCQKFYRTSAGKARERFGE